MRIVAKYSVGKNRNEQRKADEAKKKVVVVLPGTRIEPWLSPSKLSLGKLDHN